MPLALNPKNKIPVSLKCDVEDYPDEATRPAFFCRFLTCDEFLELEEIIGRAYAETDNKKSSAILDDALAMCVVGWKNLEKAGVPIPFSHPIRGVLTIGEKWELIYECQSAPRLAEIDKKKSISRRGSVSPSSVATAPAGAAASA